MTHPRSLYRIGRGEGTGSHITAQTPPQRRSREEIDADLVEKRKGITERAAKAREMLVIPPKDEWGYG